VKIIALDPGGTTGIASTMIDTNRGKCGVIATRQMVGDHHTKLYRFLISEAPSVVVCENFVYQNRMKKVALDSVEYIGVAKLYCQMTKTAYRGQMAGSAKALWTDDKIKQLGLWEKGQQHAMDAVRHLLLFVDSELGIKQFTNQIKSRL